jgi:hypothetical protein
LVTNNKKHRLSKPEPCFFVFCLVLKFLALKHRVKKYESIGRIYKNTKAQILETKLHDRLILLLIAIIDVIKNIFEEADIEELFVKIINDEQIFDKIKILIKPSTKTVLEKHL